MSFRSIVVMLLAGVCGICAVVAILNTTSLSATHSPDTVQIAVAAVEIHRGETINEKMVRMVDWPKTLVPPGAIMKPESLVDHTAISGILKDEPILELKVANDATGHGLAPLIKDGMRAFTILTPSDASGVAGFILPGNRVDVVLAVSGHDDASGGGTATTLLQNIEVLAVGQRLEAPRENKVDTKEMRSVTLAVTPDQAAKLSLAQTKGTMHLSLRSDVDENTAQVNTITLKELRFLQLPGQSNTVVGDATHDPTLVEAPAAAPPAPVVPVRKNQTIRVLRGTNAGAISVSSPSDDDAA